MKKYLAIMLIITATALTGCQKETVVPEEKSIAVTVQNISDSEIKNIDKFNGTIRVKEETPLFVELGGTVESINVDIGDKVHKGQVLLKIEGDDVQSAVDTAKASLESTKANSKNSIEQAKLNYKNALDSAQLAYDEAKRNYDIQNELYKSNIISENDFRNVEKGYNTAKQALDTALKNYNEVLPNMINATEKGVEAAEENFNHNSRNLNKLTLVSPVDGVVTQKNCTENSMVGQQQPAFVISNPNLLEVDIKVSYNDLAKFHVNQTVNVNVGENSTTGTVTNVPVVSDNSSALYTVEILLNNEKGNFKAGETAIIEVELESEKNIIKVPKKAILEEDDKDYVYIVSEDGRAQKVEVERGIETTTDVEIKNGLNKDDTVVIGGISLIGDGVKLFPVEKKED